MNSVKHGPLRKNFDENRKAEIENSSINPNNANNQTCKKICILK